MKLSKQGIITILGLWAMALPLCAQNPTNSPLSRLHWNPGPTTAILGDYAEIKIPSGYKYLNATDTRKLLELEGNPTSGAELALLTPNTDKWFVVFEFQDSGYVKDDEKNQLNPDKMLAAFKKGNDQANEWRKQHGAPPLNILAWEQPPKYNEETHNLEWAIRCESEGTLVINYSTRLLGRRGVMQVDLVVVPEQLADTLSGYQALLKDYSFKDGQRYAEYRQGDKVAKYGLAALITGGAAVVAVKTGLFAWLILKFKVFWKFIVLGFVAVVGFFKRLITGDRSKKPSA